MRWPPSKRRGLSTGYKNANRLEIHGEKGAIRFNFERMNELDWYDATLPEELQGWSTINVTNGNANHPYAGAWWPVAHVLGYEHSFVNQAADIFNVLGGGQAVVPHARLCRRLQGPAGAAGRRRVRQEPQPDPR